MEAGKNRLQYTDAIKGIALMMIVLCHILAPCIGRVILMHLECIFQACLFFFAGFSYRPASISAAERIRIKSAALFAPFLRFSLLLWIAASAYLLAAGKETVKAAFICLRNFFAGSLWDAVLMSLFHLKNYSEARNYFIMTDLWIFPAMIFASVIFYLLADRVTGSLRKTMTAAAVLLLITAVFRGFGLSLPYNLHIAPYWTSFMLFGAYAGRRRLFDRVKKEDKWVPGIVSLGLGITVAMIKQPSADLYKGSFGGNEIVSMLLCTAAALPAIWGLGQLCSLAEESGSGIIGLRWMGQNYLTVFAVHRTIAWLICLITGFSLMYDKTVSGSVILKSFLLSLAVILICMAPGTLHEVNSKRKRRSRIAAGRKNRTNSISPHDDDGSFRADSGSGHEKTGSPDPYGIERPLAERRPVYKDKK